MKKEIKKLSQDFEDGLQKCKSISSLEKLEQKFFGRKDGLITLLSKGLKDVDNSKKKEIGKLVSETRKKIEKDILKKREELEESKWDKLEKDEAIDITQPSLKTKRVGHIHPISQARKKLIDVAQAMGFKVEDGPELESDYFSFQALNIPEHHPARDSQDTFYIKDHEKWCMRPHVSNMQVRMMKKYGAPLRIIYPGRVYRNEALDATHEHTFSQFEGLMIDKKISISNLIGVLQEFINGLYGKEMEMRLRPGYFPFVEPGFEVDFKYQTDSGEKWMEMLGCGLVHPNVIREAGFDPEEYQGLAFGMGLDRLVMLKYGIDDIRHINGGDLRFLKQF
jgi:phenylalanyl-tRNA synthetase alpha chain